MAKRAIAWWFLQTIAEKLGAYLRHESTFAQLVDWAEEAIREDDFEETDLESIRDVLAPIGLADVREFGLSWEDCEALLHRLGFIARVMIQAV